ncbi:MAG: T9SS type A sorting domain-containing protein [candidate division Zixibacteria bacterium]
MSGALGLQTYGYSLPEQGEVVIYIYNLLGQRIATLFEGTREAGEHSITWDAVDFPSGVYFARLETGEQSENIKMVLLK